MISNVTIRDIQKKSLDIYMYFRDFCNKHDLTHFVCGGCAIGTLRHQGFIPWDDDIDVLMPREDYEKLYEIWNCYADTEHYSLCRTTGKENYHDAGMLLKDNCTTFINEHSQNEDINHGLMMDIIPLDGSPENKLSRMWQKCNAMAYALFNVQRLPDNKGKLIRKLSQIILFIFHSSSLRYKIWRFSERQMSKYSINENPYIVENIGSIKGISIQHPKDEFSAVIYMTFENTEVGLMKGYDSYLRSVFGDYMKLPPEEKRIAKHNAVFIDLTTSYKEYKGIYYCK